MLLLCCGLPLSSLCRAKHCGTPAGEFSECFTACLSLCPAIVCLHNKAKYSPRDHCFTSFSINGFSGSKSVDNIETQNTNISSDTNPSNVDSSDYTPTQTMAHGRGERGVRTANVCDVVQDFVPARVCSTSFTFQFDSTKTNLHIAVWSARSRKTILGDIHRL